MSRETKSKEIDGTVFTVTQLPAMRGIKLMHKLARALGPAVIKAATGGNKIGDQDIAGFGDAAQAAFDRFSAEDLDGLIKELFETGTMSLDGNTVPIMPVFNDALAGKLVTVIKAVQFALEVNYSDFLGAFLASVRLVGPAPGKAAPLLSTVS